jgi:hypothetical protein
VDGLAHHHCEQRRSGSGDTNSSPSRILDASRCITGDRKIKYEATVSALDGLCSASGSPQVDRNHFLALLAQLLDLGRPSIVLIVVFNHLTESDFAGRVSSRASG